MTEQQQKAYHQGYYDALIDICKSCDMTYSLSRMEEITRDFLKFLQAFRKAQRKDILPGETDPAMAFIWNGAYRFSNEDLLNFINLQICNFRTRLEKARQIHAINAKLLQDFTQLTIE